MPKNKTADKTQDAAKREARKAAIDALIASHSDEFGDLMLAEHEKRGVVWQRRATPAEREARDEARAAERERAKAERAKAKEEKALADLLAKHPSLAERIVTGTEGQ